MNIWLQSTPPPLSTQTLTAIEHVKKLKPLQGDVYICMGSDIPRTCTYLALIESIIWSISLKLSLQVF